MKLAGFLMMASGWIIALAAVAMLPSDPPRTIFALAGAGVEVIGLVLAFRAHAAPWREER